MRILTGMNLEFHYYAIAALALRAGYPADLAHLIARSSQQVDQALVAHDILDFPTQGGGIYRTEKTQDYVFWDEAVSRDIYLPFHFIPGEPAKAARERIDGLVNPWIVTPDSPLAREILIAALKTENPHRIGIALHAYADTWAHQNFTGRLEQANEMPGAAPLPAAGHLHALTSPDLPTGRWNDPRLFDPDIDNRVRFIAAARMIFRFLRTSLRREFDDEGQVLDELGKIWARPDLDDEARSFDFTIRFDIEPWSSRLWLVEAGISKKDGDERPRGYDKLRWLRSELARRSGQGEGIRSVDSGGSFARSSLYAWCEAARGHRREVLRLIDARLGGSLSAAET